jgi:hypothetical protein
MKNFCLLIEKSLTSNECNAYNAYGKFSKAKAKFSEFAKTVIEEEIERLSNESAVLKKSA